MTLEERIAALEARCAACEARRRRRKRPVGFVAAEGGPIEAYTHSQDREGDEFGDDPEEERKR